MQTRSAVVSNRLARPGRMAGARAAAVACLMAACGYHSWELTRGSGLTSSAAGNVALGESGPQGRPVEVRVFHVEEPATLATGARSYVVWLAPDKDQQPQNLGALALSLSGDGQSSNGILRATTRYDEFRIFVTPEETAQVEAPHNQRVFWASVGSR